MKLKWASRFELKPGTWIFVPTDESIENGASIKAAIEERWKPPKNYFHLLDGGHVEALKSHLENKSFIHLDIQDFFGSINRTRVTRCLKDIFGYAQAREMANHSTVIHPEREGRQFILPFGFVQSPLIASLCLYKSALGAYLRKLQGMDGVTVSVYVDDIVISTTKEELSSSILSEVKRAAERSAFTLNESKEEGPAESVSAFNIELSHQSLIIQPKRWLEFVDAFKASDSEHQKLGILGYVMSVNFTQADELVS